MNSTVYATLIKLCVDICKRNGKNKLIWLGDKNKTLNCSPKSDEMVLTVRRWFANKSCPGDWLYSRLGDLASNVTAQLGGSNSATDNGTSTSGFYMHYRASYTVVNVGIFSEELRGKLGAHLITNGDVPAELRRVRKKAVMLRQSANQKFKKQS